MYVSNMHIPKKYLHDKFVLLLVSINAFLVATCIALILLRGLGQGTDTYIVGYRDSLGTINPFLRGDIFDLLAFALFSIVVVVINTIISIRAYHLRRSLALTILGLGTLTLLFAVIVSNALFAQN